MANIANNNCIINGNNKDIKKLYDYLEEIDFEFDTPFEYDEGDEDDETQYADSFVSKWTEPHELLCELSQKFNVQIMGNTFESGMEYMSIWKYENGTGIVKTLDD